MSCMAVADAKGEVYTEIRDREPTPMELLRKFHRQITYQLLQDVLREMLENGEIQLGSDRHLRVRR